MERGLDPAEQSRWKTGKVRPADKPQAAGSMHKSSRPCENYTQVRRETGRRERVRVRIWLFCLPGFAYRARFPTVQSCYQPPFEARRGGRRGCHLYFAREVTFLSCADRPCLTET